MQRVFQLLDLARLSVPRFLRLRIRPLVCVRLSARERKCVCVSLSLSLCVSVNLCGWVERMWTHEDRCFSVYMHALLVWHMQMLMRVIDIWMLMHTLIYVIDIRMRMHMLAHVINVWMRMESLKLQYLQDTRYRMCSLTIECVLSL